MKLEFTQDQIDHLEWLLDSTEHFAEDDFDPSSKAYKEFHTLHQSIRSLLSNDL